METSGAIQASLSGRYARALFDLARDDDKLAPVSADVATLTAALASSDDLRALTTNPVMARDDAAKAMEAVAAHLDLTPLTRNFLGTLAHNMRLDQLPAIMAAFDAMAAAHRGEVTAHVTTAHPLDDAQRDALIAKLKPQSGGTVTLAEHIDPNILGGLIVKIGSQMIDGSIATKLNTLALAMKG